MLVSRTTLRNTDPWKTETATGPPHLPSLEQPTFCCGHFDSRVQIATNYGALFYFCCATAQTRPRLPRFEDSRSLTIVNTQPVGLPLTSVQQSTQVAAYTTQTQDTIIHALCGIRPRDPSNLMP
jgi:hypothetical protein